MTFQSDKDVLVTADSTGFKTIVILLMYIDTRFFTAYLIQLFTNKSWFVKKIVFTLWAYTLQRKTASIQSFGQRLMLEPIACNAPHKPVADALPNEAMSSRGQIKTYFFETFKITPGIVTVSVASIFKYVGIKLSYSPVRQICL